MRNQDVQVGKVYGFQTGTLKGLIKIGAPCSNGWWDWSGTLWRNTECEYSTNPYSGGVKHEWLTGEVAAPPYAPADKAGYATFDGVYYPLPGMVVPQLLRSSKGDPVEIGYCYEYMKGTECVGLVVVTDVDNRYATGTFAVTDHGHPTFYFGGSFTMSMLGYRILDVPHAPQGPAFITIEGKVFRNPHFQPKVEIGKTYRHISGGGGRIKVTEIGKQFIGGYYTYSVDAVEKYGNTVPASTAISVNNITTEEMEDVWTEGCMDFYRKPVSEFLAAKAAAAAPAAKLRWKTTIQTGMGIVVSIVDVVSREDAISQIKKYCESDEYNVGHIDWANVKFSASQI